MQPNNQVQKPFFAQFLEAQAENQQAGFLPVTGKLVDGPGDVTLKYPSDSDESVDL